MSDGHAPHAAPLALEPSGFFGRSNELSEVNAAISGGWRLITLVGPPGVGKTRLARRAVADLEGPVAFADLASVRDRDGLVAAVAAAIGVSLASESSSTSSTAVAHALARTGRIVVVLDNFEQLQEHADVVAAWLVAAPRAVFVVTSRERMRIGGERPLELGPLSIAAGVALFEERARNTLGRPLVDDERAEAEHIVRRVDGMPLAIELAAGRAALLGVREVHARLDRSLAFLRDAHGGDGRHASVEAAVAWSWDLLTVDEQSALAQLSVFAGSFTLDAAEAVVSLPRGNVVDALQALRERSLVWGRRDGSSARFGLFEIVRTLAATKLAAPGDAALRHARFFATKASDLNDAANVEAALAYAASTADDALTASLALASSSLFRRRGARAAHEAALSIGVEAARRCARTDLEAELLHARAALASGAGENDVALACQERALAIASEAHDVSAQSFARARRGWDRFELGDVDAGLQDIRVAVDEAMRAKDQGREAYARNRLGLALYQCGSTSSALDELARAAALASQAKSADSIASLWLRQKALVELASTSRKLGAVEQAAQRLLELGALGAPVDRTLQAMAALEHAAIARAFGRCDDALRLIDDAIAGADDEGGPRLRAAARIERAVILADLGKHDDALAVLDDALAIAARVQNATYRAHALLEAARIRGDRDDVEGAHAALDLADAALASGEDAACEGAVLVERAVLAVDSDERAARAFADKALLVLQRVGGKHLVRALAVAGLVDGTHLDERRVAAEALLPRFGDVDAKAAVALLRGQPAPEENALARRLLALRGGKARREMVIGADGRYYELDGQRISLQRQRSLRLILLALVDHAEKRPGIGMTQVEVLARGWPGEKMRPDSGATRVYTSIRRLRRGGLAGVLITRDDGYLLDPSVTVRRI